MKRLLFVLFPPLLLVWVCVSVGVSLGTVPLSAAEITIPEGSLLAWDGDSPEKSGIVQLARVHETGAYRGKCLEAWWPERPKRTNPVIVFGQKRPIYDLAPYEMLCFFAKASEEGKTFRVELRQWSGRVAYLDIDKYIEGGKLTTEWRLVKLPLNRFVANDTWQNQVDHIVFTENNDRSSLPKKLYLDEIYFVRTPHEKEGKRTQ